MKVLAVNSSPRGGENSKSDIMMNALVDGLNEAGADVEVVRLREKKINYCLGCFSCWGPTSGECVQKDDMSKELYPKWRESDLVIYSTPLYHFTVNACLKTFIERTLPIGTREIKKYEGKSYHPLRYKHPGIVMLSVAGFEEDSVFDALAEYSAFTFKKALKAEIYRPAAEAMVFPPYKDQLDDILDATKQAGRELVDSMSISDETMARIKQPISFVDSPDLQTD